MKCKKYGILLIMIFVMHGCGFLQPRRQSPGYVKLMAGMTNAEFQDVVRTIGAVDISASHSSDNQIDDSANQAMTYWLFQRHSTVVCVYTSAGRISRIDRWNKIDFDRGAEQRSANRKRIREINFSKSDSGVEISLTSE